MSNIYFYLEMLSEAVKLLKGEYCVRAITELNMDYAIIFCRTKIDCDNLESYLNSIGILLFAYILLFSFSICLNYYKF